MNFIELREQFGTPLYVYSEEALKKAAREVLSLPVPFGLTVRYAMKALPTRAILQLFSSLGVEVDASSGYEVERAMAAGIPASKILLTAQELPHHLKTLVEAGVHYTACSLHQLASFGELFFGKEVSVRINPGEGSGAHAKVTVAGEHASFGIWHEDIPQVLELLEKYQLRVVRVHTHVGSGTDPELWGSVVERSISLLKHFPEAQILDVGGGFKVARVEGEKSADMALIGQKMAEVLKAFEKESGRKIHLEVEPGTYLVANAGTLLATVQDLTKTPEMTFLKLDAGMTEIIRPAMYGSQHPLTLFSNETEKENYVVVGHCCESADLLTPDPNQADLPMKRTFPKAKIGDLVAVGGAGAYCSSMSTVGYNSFPQAAEVLLLETGEARLIRARQSAQQLVENEL